MITPQDRFAEAPTLPDSSSATTTGAFGRAGADMLPENLDLQAAIDAFILSRQIRGCTAATVRNYRDDLGLFARFVGLDRLLREISLLDCQRYLANLRERMNGTSVHHYAAGVHVFFRWAVASELIPKDPMATIRTILPETLPKAPPAEQVAKLLAACGTGWYGTRNRALVMLLGDSGLRRAEAIRLRIEDVDFQHRMVFVRLGKNQEDKTGHFGGETTSALRRWLNVRAGAHAEDSLFVSKGGDQLTLSYATCLLARLSRRAGLARTITPHRLRHHAGTTVLVATGDLELVRSLLNHRTLMMATRYARLTRVDIRRKFERASPMDLLKHGR